MTLVTCDCSKMRDSLGDKRGGGGGTTAMGVGGHVHSPMGVGQAPQISCFVSVYCTMICTMIGMKTFCFRVKIADIAPQPPAATPPTFSAHPSLALLPSPPPPPPVAQEARPKSGNTAVRPGGPVLKPKPCFLEWALSHSLKTIAQHTRLERGGRGGHPPSSIGVRPF